MAKKTHSLATMGDHSFLPEDFEGIPASKNKEQYMKFQVGDNVVRILSNPLMGYQIFTEDNKPVRKAYDSSDKNKGNFSLDELHEHKAKKDDEGNITQGKFFWAVLLWDYRSAKPRIVEITQTGILTSLFEYAKDSDWGDPRQYDINVKRKGSTKNDTEYSLQVKPKKKLAKEIIVALEQIDQSEAFDLNRIFDGKHPFEFYDF